MLLRGLLIVLMLMGFAVPLAAQTDLDRTEPTQAVDEDDRRDSEIDDASRVPTIDVAEPGTTDRPGPGAIIGSIAIEGNRELPDRAFVDLIETFTARRLAQEDLQTLANAVASRARDRGFILATASIPGQDLSLGVLRVRLDEGAVDRIELEGAQDRAIRRQLEPLLSAGPVMRATSSNGAFCSQTIFRAFASWIRVTRRTGMPGS